MVRSTLLVSAVLAVVLLPVVVLAAAGSESRDGVPASARASRPAARPPLPGDDGAAVVARLRAAAQRSAVRRARAGAHRRNALARVPRAQVAPYLPLYRQAAAHYRVSWLVLASVHKQETAFSTAPGTYVGLNFAGCCAGPMQFNLMNKPVSTWRRFGDAFRTGPPRPPSYPHRTARHPSPYDDWDAILAAARLLAANGAGPTIDSAAWRSAYLYYGPGSLDEDDFGISYADEVIARALGWARRGFCPACATDRSLVRAVHAAWALGPAETTGKDAERRGRKGRQARAERRRRQARRRREQERRRDGRGAPRPAERRDAPRRRPADRRPAEPRPGAKARAPQRPAQPDGGAGEPRPAPGGGAAPGGDSPSGGGSPSGGASSPGVVPTPTAPLPVPRTDPDPDDAMANPAAPSA